MTDPLRFEPIQVAKPWGGDALARRFGRPALDVPVGESWELVSLPGSESTCRSAPWRGRTLGELVAESRGPLLGSAELVDGRFPLLIKLLDARAHLSVQVHPKPPAGQVLGPGVKHEAWVVLDCDPGAELFIGLRRGVGPADVAAAANTPAMRDLLEPRPAVVGATFYLPSGLIHALGAGIVVAEVQTPSDVTYRLYDWDRVDARGQSRALHLEQGLANIRYDVRETEIVQSDPSRAPDAEHTPLCLCPRFRIDRYEIGVERTLPLPGEAFRVGIFTAGAATVRGKSEAVGVRAGDTLLVPAACSALTVTPDVEASWLDVTPTAGDATVRAGSA